MTRPLLLTASPRSLDDLLRLAALAAVEPDVADDVAGARRVWAGASLVLVGEDLLDALAQAQLPRRPGVVVLGRDLDDATVWQRAVHVGAERVVFLPEAESWLVDALADAAEGLGPEARLVAVVGGRGGAGATTLACALAQVAAKRGMSPLLLDADPLGGGVDVVFRAEDTPGLRWPDLVGSRGRIAASALARALPRVDGLSLLSWDRGDATDLPAESMRAVLHAARRGHGLVVADVSRHLEPSSREVLAAASTVLLVVPAEIRAAAAAGRVAARLVGVSADVRLVVRGPSPAGLGAAEIQAALGLPLAGEVRAEPQLARALEEGMPPGSRRGSPLVGLCHSLLDRLSGAATAAAPPAPVLAPAHALSA